MNAAQSEKGKYTHPELHQGSVNSKLNWLRAAVLGANDGIVSTAGLVIGVAGATNSTAIILAAGIAGMVSGAISMAAGEYVSVSSSRDTEKALIEKEKYEIEKFPEEELLELAEIYQRKGLSKKVAMEVARELSAKDPIKAHLDAELNIDPDELTNPWHAAFASSLSFFSGAMIPLVVILLPPASVRIPVAFISVVLALVITGALSGRASGAGILKAIVRVTLGGILAMGVTFAIGKVFNISGL